MRSQGINEKDIELATVLRVKLYDLNRAILAGRPFQAMRASISQELIANKDAKWFGPAELPPQLSGELPPSGALRLLFFDPATVWERLRKPAYVVWGDKDTVVPVDKSKAIIETAQRQARNKFLTTRVFKGVDHSNNIVASKTEWDFPRASTEIEVSMAQWILKIIES
jgi:pimeloyl-ACP methyl ester carboxylesterase